MSIDCLNKMTIVCINEDIIGELNKLIMNELQYKKNNQYVYNNTINIIKKGKRGIEFNLWSQWSPDFEWLKSLIHKYPNCWIKNEWNCDSGLAGVWLGYNDTNKNIIIKNKSWDNLSAEDKAYLFMDENEEK
jgi:hypothetical protein